MKLALSFRCPMAWSDLVGDDAVRHCSTCDKSVTSLSNMAPAAARALVRRAGGELCVSAVVSRRTGTVVHGARAAAFMAGLATSATAAADGSIPALTQPVLAPVADEHAPATEAQPDEAQQAQAADVDPDAEAVPVLDDVEDADCTGELVSEETEQLMLMLGGIR